jgi:hypothetical protein
MMEQKTQFEADPYCLLTFSLVPLLVDLWVRMIESCGYDNRVVHQCTFRHACCTCLNGAQNTIGRALMQHREASMHAGIHLP